jgi:hypothetical protein
VVPVIVAERPIKVREAIVAEMMKTSVTAYQNPNTHTTVDVSHVDCLQAPGAQQSRVIADSTQNNAENWWDYRRKTRTDLTEEGFGHLPGKRKSAKSEVI